MPPGPDPARTGAVLGRLEALRAGASAAEDDVLACLVVTGEPRPQRVVDDWLDQVVDTLRALAEEAEDLARGLARHAAPPPAPRAGDAAPPDPTRPQQWVVDP